jgi:hypothetical protein
LELIINAIDDNKSSQSWLMETIRWNHLIIILILIFLPTFVFKLENFEWNEVHLYRKKNDEFSFEISYFIEWFRKIENQFLIPFCWNKRKKLFITFLWYNILIKIIKISILFLSRIFIWSLMFAVRVFQLYSIVHKIKICIHHRY